MNPPSGGSPAIEPAARVAISAVIGIYKALELYFSESLAQQWVSLPNDGPLFGGARPVETMIEDGLPQFLRVRSYLDALRGGA